jgi:hypothetical protein
MIGDGVGEPDTPTNDDDDDGDEEDEEEETTKLDDDGVELLTNGLDDVRSITL